MSADRARIAELHRSAMRLAHLAAERAEPELASQLYARAFEEEREAAELLVTVLDMEPTRAVLYRSATSLGMSCRRMQEAYSVLINGLASRSPEVRAELHELQGELDRSLAARMNAAEARGNLERTWNSRNWRERIPEILAAYLGKMDRYLELNGVSVEEAKEIVLLALTRLHASAEWLGDVAALDLALFDILHDLCVERRPRRDPSG